MTQARTQLAHHTPGPWEWGIYQTPDAGHVLSVVTTDVNGVDRTICRVSTLELADTIDSANAQLIAASPEMLRELEDTAAWIDEGTQQILNMLVEPGGWSPGLAVAQKRQALRRIVEHARDRSLMIRRVLTLARGPSVHNGPKET
jgi:hypothetical protein